MPLPAPNVLIPATPESPVACHRFVARWAGLWGVLLACVLHGAAPSELEYKVKAGYLFNFAKLVEWPAPSFPAPDTPLVISVWDEERGEVLPILRQVLAGKTVNGHPLRVEAYPALSPGPPAHILFICRTAQLPAPVDYASFGASTTLLVGEMDHFAETGGIINFIRRGENIRLEVNLEAAGARGLKLSAQLARLATVVRASERPPP